MDDSAPEAPSPAPPLARFEPAGPLEDGQSRPSDRADPVAEAEARTLRPPAAAPEADAGPGTEADRRASDLLAPGPSDRSDVGAWDALADRAAHYATRARTRRTYRSAWTHF